MLSSSYAQGAVAFFSLITMGLASTCNPKSDPIPNFSISDGRNLQNDIHGNVFTPKLDFPFLIEAAHTATFSLGSAIACLLNTSPFENTHLEQTDLAFAVQTLLDNCDNGDGTSKGGQTQVIGDTKLVVQLYLRDIALGCDSF
ncbi:hypothetical protein V8C37DRAFT_300379 [Trichoderma ceciliae]